MVKGGHVTIICTFAIRMHIYRCSRMHSQWYIDLPASLDTGLLRSGVVPLWRAEFRALCDGVRTGGVGEWEGEGLIKEDTCFNLDFGGGFSAADLSNSLSCSAISTCSLPTPVVKLEGERERDREGEKRMDEKVRIAPRGTERE